MSLVSNLFQQNPQVSKASSSTPEDSSGQSVLSRVRSSYQIPTQQKKESGLNRALDVLSAPLNFVNKNLVRPVVDTLAKPFGETVASSYEALGESAPSWTKGNRLATPEILAAESTIKKKGLSSFLGNPQVQKDAGKLAETLRENGYKGAGLTDILNVLSLLPGEGAIAKGAEAIGGAAKAAGASKFIPSAVEAIKTAAPAGAAWGGVYGLASGIDEKQSAAQIATQTALGSLVGATFGVGAGILGAGAGSLANKASQMINKDARVQAIVNENLRALTKLEDSNISIRKVLQKNSDRGIDAKKLLAQTDLLQGAVDKDGVIRTTHDGGAVSQLQDFIKPQEGVVRKNLEKEGKALSLKDVQETMLQNIYDSKITGEDETRAINKAKREISALRRRADKQGNISLANLQDAKTYKYNNVDYLNPGSKNADKLIAKTYKELIEENTKSIDVKALNKELAAHYAVLGLLEKLDGKKVTGGRLGKYFAQTVGSIVGSHFGPLGSIVGAEVGGRLRGSQMASTFSRATGKKLESSALMNEAIDLGQSSNSLGSLNTNQSSTIAPMRNGISSSVSQPEHPSFFQQMGVSHPSAYPVQSVENPSVNIGKAKGLSSVDRSVEDAAIKRVVSDEAGLLKRHAEMENTNGGKIVNTDDFRKLFKEDGYAGHNANAVQEPASYLAKKAFTKGLDNPEPYATFYAGGSGTGKTSAVKNLPMIQEILDKSAVVSDGNLSSYSSAKKRILEAANAGKKTPIVYVYRDPLDAFEHGVVKRMIDNAEEGGRLVPSKVVAENHIGSFETVKRLDDEGYKVLSIDNSLGKNNSKLVRFSELKNKIHYPSVQELTKVLNTKAKELYEQGKITKVQYEAYIK